MRRLIAVQVWLLVFGAVLPSISSAATVTELLAQARQAQAQVRALKSQRWGTDEKQRAIQLLGPIALNFLSAPDLAQAAANQKSQVRELYEALSEPLDSIYDESIARLESMSKSVMDRDGDLEALYETKEWKDAQTVASQSLYFLNWLHYVGAFVSDGAARKKLLDECAKGFSEFAVGEQSSQLKRESLFGRALCEKENKHFDWAIRDLELLLKDTSLPTDMERKVRAALADARNRQVRGDRATEAAESAADAQARAMLQKAQSLLDAGKKLGGNDRTRKLLEAVAYLDEVRKQGGSWKEKADAMAKSEISDQDLALVDEVKNPFPAWGQARELLQKNDYAKAIPYLREVLAAADPKAKLHHREAQYYLAVGLYQIRDYRGALPELAKVLNTEGVAANFVVDAVYLRFKASEALYTKDQNPDNTKMFLEATKEFIRRYPEHKVIAEAYYRLGEYNQGQKNYLAAADFYNKVNGDLTLRARADFGTLQSYFALLDILEEKKDGVGISEPELRKRTAAALQTFWKNLTALENTADGTKPVPVQEYRGKATVMNAAFLSKDADANAKEILTLLQDFEKKYPDQKEAFGKVARMRLVATEKAGRFADLEKEVDSIFTRFTPEEQKDLLAGLDKVLPKDVKRLEKQNDKDNLLPAKRTLARLYADRLQRGVPFAEDESPQQFKYELAQLYLDVKDYDKAIPLYQELQQGAYSLVSLAGLAQIAEVKGDQRQSLGYWEELLKGTQVGDPLWFRGTYEVARLDAALGEKDTSCKTISSARAILARLGDQGLKKKIQDLAVQSCGKG
ncbi:MAG TPA: tetratricopeptide repeat protein [Methylomirabilota bacterium]|nr:tetratricopeptide repeat protein [Methylomirabilota bacterium]